MDIKIRVKKGGEIVNLEDKFHMTQEQNIFLAKRNMVDYIYKSAKLEGINITFPETQTIFQGVGIDGIHVEDIIKINNMKRAWRFLLETLDRLTDFDYLSRINMIIGSEGSIYGAGKLEHIMLKYQERNGNLNCRLNII